MLGRVSDKCVCSYCLTVVNLHEKQISEEGIMISLPPNPKSPCWRLNAPVPLVTTTLLLKLSWGLIQGVVSAVQRMVRWPHSIPG